MERETRALRWLTGVSLGIGLLVVLNHIMIPFLLYYPTTTHTVLISDSIDSSLFLISSACVPGTFAAFWRKLGRSSLLGILVIWSVGIILTLAGQSYGAAILYLTVMYAAVVNTSKGDRETRRLAAADLLLCTLAIFALIEFSAAFYWITSAVNPQGHVGFSSEELEVNLTFSLFPLSMTMILLLLFSWLWIPIAMRLPILRNTTRIRVQYSTFGENIRSMVAASDLFAILAILIFFYTYAAGQTWIVGVDSIIRYVTPLTQLAGLSPSQAFAASYRHGLYIVLLYAIELATGLSSTTIVKFAPLVLTFATGSATLLAVLRAGWSLRLAILASMSSLLWLPTTLGVYAGIQANWAAFVLWMLYLAFLFMNREWNAFVFIFQGLLSLAIFLIHPWTWGVFLASLVLTAIISSRGPWMRRSLQGVIAAVAITLPLGFLAYQYLPGLRADLADTLTLYASSYLYPVRLLSFGNALGETLFTWGPFLSPLLLLLSLVGAYSMTSRGGIARSYLLAWIATWCLGSFLVAPIGYNPTNSAVSETQLWRMLYVSPLPILLGMGIEKCLEISKNLEPPGSSKLLTRVHFALLSAILVGFSAALYVSQMDNNALSLFVRVLTVLGTLTTLLLVTIRLPKDQVSRLLFASILILFLVNAAYRSLYPLLLDPHNLLGSFSGLGR